MFVKSRFGTPASRCGDVSTRNFPTRPHLLYQQLARASPWNSFSNRFVDADINAIDLWRSYLKRKRVGCTKHT